MKAVRIVALHAGALAVLLGTAPAASAQDGELIGDVEISFDVGDVDEASGDWTIDSVDVSGDLEDGQDFTVVLLDADGESLWTATAEYTDPVTTIEITDVVLIGQVASAGVEQGITVVEGVQIEPPVIEWSAGGGAGGGDLALSLVLAVFVVALVFRTPLPSATSQRWTA